MGTYLYVCPSPLCTYVYICLGTCVYPRVLTCICMHVHICMYCVCVTPWVAIYVCLCVHVLIMQVHYIQERPKSQYLEMKQLAPEGAWSLVLVKHKMARLGEQTT